MKLSIVTINYNDAHGLAKTLKSVANQHIPDGFELEHIIIDGASTDDSVDVIKQYLHVAKWVSEKDNGVYNAMNKGIKMATGDYIQILNSGDILASDTVLSRMYDALIASRPSPLASLPEILYGNMLKAMPDGKFVRDNCGGPGVGNSFLYFYKGTLNHDCAWIKRSLFDRFGLYDEDMRICSDWKWYVNTIALGYNPDSPMPSRLSPIAPVYVDIDVTIFDMNGISESGGKNKTIIEQERRGYLKQVLPVSVLNDYEMYSFPILQYQRLKKYHLWGIVHIMERILFKLEKWNILKK